MDNKTLDQSNVNTGLREEYVPYKSRIWVSAADGFVNLLQGIVGGGVLTYYFTKIRGLEKELAAIVWILFGVWNAINDPLYGYISDKTKSKLGRRIPYIRYGAPLLSISYILCWIDWSGQHSQGMLFAQLLIFLFFYDTFYTAVASALYVMPFEMAISNKARGTILVWKIIFSVIGITVPLVLMPQINPDIGESTLFYQIFHIALGIFVAIIAYTSTFFYKERYSAQKEEQPSLIDSFKFTLTNKSFIIFEIISFTIVYVQTNLMQGMQYYPAELEDKVNILYPYLALALGIIIGLVLLIKNTDQWGVKNSMQAIMGSFSLGCFFVLIGGKTTIVTTIGFLFMGFGVAGGYYTLQLMFGDVMDFDEVKTGKRREGMYAGINAFITKPAISVAQAVFLWIIAAYDYDDNLPFGQQTEHTETGIIIGWVLIPTILLLICFITMFFYPLAGKAWTKTKNEMAIKHKKREEKILKEYGYKA